MSIYYLDNIDNLRAQFCRDYLSFYKELAFEALQPLPLRIHYDPSLFFTTCSICIYKKWYFDHIEPRKYCVIQPAFRTNTYRELHLNKPLAYTARLTVCGTFCPTDNTRFREDFESAMMWQAKFVSGWLRQKQFIRITVPKLLDSLLSQKCKEALHSLGIFMVYGEKGLWWNYGMDDIHGLGTRWEIVSNNRNYNWGNVIVIFKDNVPIGIESGGSIEVMLQGVLGLPHKIFINQYCSKKIASEIIHIGSDAIKYFDALDVIATILWETRTEMSLPLQISDVLEQYTRAFKCLIVLGQIDRYTCEHHVACYEHSHKGWSQCSGVLINQIRERVFSQWSLRVLIKNMTNKRKNHWRGFSPLEQRAISFAAKNPLLLWFEGEDKHKNETIAL